MRVAQAPGGVTLMRVARAAARLCLLMVVGTCASPCGAYAQAADGMTFEQLVAELGNEEPGVRLRAVQALRQAASPEAALPLTRSLADPEDGIQLEAIGAELNIFAASKAVPRRRVGLVVEVRDRISAVTLFNQGAIAVDPRPVAMDVLTALRTAGHDDNARVSAEALYAFGTLSENAYGADRRALLTASGPELAAALGVPQAEVRAAAVRVIARVYGWRLGDLAVDEVIGDAVVAALNDREYGIRMTAMDALGSLRYDRGVQALTDIYQHFARGAVAVGALSALARIAHPSSLPLFAAALEGRDVSLRVAAIEGLARGGAVDSVPAIAAALLRERNEDVLLAGHFAKVLLSDGAVDDLVGGLARSRLRPRARQYLVDVGPGRARMIGPHVQDPQAAIRADLVEVLGLSGDPDAVSIAARLQQDEDPGVARAAGRAVARLRAADAQRP